ncbi:hypothetical protein [Sinorhizobium meliloti]|uniref:hypothetical protein n=1 Tax=Rhizobium meliloti TaxID=382 RepID=UPI000FD89F32|nr:hypothetical protein [Sinorhizobium meliloti]RVP20767.1 hypothetical protein CN080_21045 [Sinorhizobium meliloti]
MAYHDLASVSCVTLKDFNDLLSISFGINLALPVFRELVVFNRRVPVARIPAIQSIVEGRNYIDAAQKQAHLSALSKAKVKLIACDKDLSEKINVCAVVTFLFAVASLGWIWLGIYNPRCLSGWMAFSSVGISFLPLPISIIYLAWKSRAGFDEVSKLLDRLMEDLM